MLLCGVYLQGKAQDYIPLAVEDAYYVIRGTDPEGYLPDGYHGHRIKGDTIINGKIYKKVYYQYYTTENGWGYPPLTYTGESLRGVVRDDIEERKVYAIIFGVNGVCPSNEEYLLFNYNLQLNDTSDNSLCNYGYYTVTEINYFEIFGTIRKVIKLNQWDYNYALIYEGIGSYNGLFGDLTCFEPYSILYKYCIGEDCLGDLIVSSTEKLPMKLKIEINPNPATDLLDIEFSEKSNYTMIINNILGETIIEKQVSTSHETINISNFEKGIYILQVIQNNKQISIQKFIKQ